MVALSAHPAAASTVPVWNLFFARETEPDLDFDEELDDLDDTPPSSYSPRDPRKKSGRSPLLWVLLLVVVAGGGYYYMAPDAVMELIGPYIGESPAPPMVVQPPPKSPAQAPPAPVGGTAPASPETVTTAPAVAAIPSPQFAEGQQVSVILDPAAPGGALSLSADAAGTRPGPTVRPGVTLTVMDGDLQNNTWVYSVRTQDGASGWIAENRLVAKP